MQPIYASASEVLSRWVFRALDAILEEVDHLHNVSTRFEGTGGAAHSHNGSTDDDCGIVRNIVTILVVLVATKFLKRI